MAVVALLLVFAVGSSVALSSYARRIEQGPGTVAERLQLLKRASILHAIVLEVGIVAAALAARLPHRLSVAWPVLADNDGPLMLAIAAGVGLLIVVISVAQHLASAPSVRRMRMLEETPRQGAGALLRGLALVFLPVGVLASAAILSSSIAPGNWAVRAFMQAGAFAGIAALAPLIVRIAIRTYDADDPTRRHLLELCARHNLRVRGIKLYRTRGQKRANALFVGVVPSRRYVYVSDYLVDNFSGPELDAVMAHEICHGKEHHLVIRLALFAVAIALFSVPGGALFGYVLFLVAGGVLSRRFETRADEYAKRTVGAAAMVAALRRLAELNDTPLTTGHWTLPGSHPSFARRIERLGGSIDIEQSSRRRRPKLPLRWRVALPVAWVAVTVIAVVSGSGEPSISYPAVVSASFVVAMTAVFVVPVVAAFGWRWAPLASVLGAATMLVPSYSDARHPLPSGRLEFCMSVLLTALSVVALRDPRVRDLMQRHQPQTDDRRGVLQKAH